jgi:RecB family endonuclease NucS
MKRSVASEQLLENMIVRDSRLLSHEWQLVGRQEHTGLGGIIDLLALAPDGSLVLIELKRGRTPREVVAQSLDYASWVEKVEPDILAEIFKRFKPGRDLAQAFF